MADEAKVSIRRDFNLTAAAERLNLLFDGVLNLDFITETDNAKVSAIEVLPLGLPPQSEI